MMGRRGIAGVVVSALLLWWVGGVGGWFAADGSAVGAGAGSGLGARDAAGAAPLGRVGDVRRPLVLSGAELSIADILAVAGEGKPVEISAKARARVATTFEVVLAAARANLPVYGLTTGVGWNKDKDALKAADALDPDLMAASQRFNLGTLRAHAAGVGEALPDEVVRAAMVIRLNLLLTGDGGVQPVVVDQYAAFFEPGDHSGCAGARECW